MYLGSLGHLLLHGILHCDFRLDTVACHWDILCHNFFEILSKFQENCKRDESYATEKATVFGKDTVSDLHSFCSMLDSLRCSHGCRP